MDSCRENACLRCLCEYFTTVVRVTGVIIAIVIWIIAIGALVPSLGAGVYLIFVAIVLSILEGLFLFESCITSCCTNDGCCGKTWTIVLYLDNWKRSILYIGICIPCFFIAGKAWSVYIAGGTLLLLAAMYLLLSLYPKPKPELTEEQTGVDRDKYIFLNI